MASYMICELGGGNESGASLASERHSSMDQKTADHQQVQYHQDAIAHIDLQLS